MVVAVLVLSLVYHDGVIAVAPITTATEHGLQYRLRGTVSDVTKESFTLSDGAGTVTVLWNVTDPSPGSRYVVVGVFNATADALHGAAVSLVYFF